MWNPFIFELSDEELSLINAEELKIQDPAAIEEFFNLKLRKGFISAEMISAAIDKELSETLAKEILVRAERNTSTAKLVRDFHQLAHQASMEYMEVEKALQLPTETRQLTRNSARRIKSKYSGDQPSGLMMLLGDTSLQVPPRPPLRDSVLMKLTALDERNKDQRVTAGYLNSLLRSLKDLTTFRVGAPAFASLLVGIISTSVLYQFTNPRDNLPSSEYVTRGSISEVDVDPGIYLMESSGMAFERPILLQSGNQVQNGGNVAEGVPWTISAGSKLDGNASLYSSDSDGTLNLLDTQAAYDGYIFTFSNLEVSDQSTLDLRVTIVNEDDSIEISYNLSYLVR